MKKYLQYQPDTGFIVATVLSHAAPDCNHQIEMEPEVETEGMMLDMNQNPPVLVPLPPAPFIEDIEE